MYCFFGLICDNEVSVKLQKEREKSMGNEMSEKELKIETKKQPSLVSICIITKNEKEKLEKCLKSFQDTGYDIVVVDTGSTDGTQEMVKKYTPYLYDFEWVNDFSAARNFAISKVESEYIIMADSDETLKEWDKKTFETRMKEHPKGLGCIRKENLLSDDGKDYTICDEPRVFSKKYYHYEGAIHEQVVPRSNEFPKREYYHTTISFIHTGYIGTDEEKARKIKRNIDLLEAESEKNPEDVYIWFQIGKGYYMGKDYENACKYFGKALEFDVDESLDYVQDLVESYGYSLVNTKQYEMAYSLLQVTYDAFARTADYHFLAGLIYMQNAMFEDAVKEFLLATKNERVCVVGANSYKAFYNIGVIYECLGDKKNARLYYEKCGCYDLAKERLKEV